MVIFEFVNCVVLLSLAIAIICVTYGMFYEFENGLYYDELIRVMPEYQYDDKFGFIVCAWTPLHILFFAMIPLMEYTALYQP